VLVGPARADRLEAACRAVEELGAREIALPTDAARQLAILRADTRPHAPDCCVLLAAEPCAHRS